MVDTSIFCEKRFDLHIRTHIISRDLAVQMEDFSSFFDVCAILTCMSEKVLEAYIRDIISEARGIFDPPPVMYKAILEWVLSTYASDTWARAEAVMERKGQTAEGTQEYFENVYKEIPSVLDSLKNKQSHRWKISGPRIETYYIGVKRIPDNVENTIKQRGDNPKDPPLFVWGWGKKKINFGGEWWDNMDKETTHKKLKQEIGLAASNVISKLNTRDRYGKAPSVGLERLNGVIEECKKYTTRPKRYVSKATKKFKIDTTDWEYIKGRKSPIVDMANKMIAGKNKEMNDLIAIAKEQLEIAQEVWDEYHSEAGMKQGEIKNSLQGNWSIEKSGGWTGSVRKIYIESYYKWGNTPEWLFGEDGEKTKRPTTAYVYNMEMRDSYDDYDPDKEFIPLKMFAKNLVASLDYGEVEAALREFQWSHINVVVNFMGHKKRVGVWSRMDNIVEVDVPKIRLSKDNFTEALASIERTTKHEIQHVAQDLLKTILMLKIPGGLPPVSVMKDKDKEALDKRNFNPRGIEHGLKDIEFQTDLAGEIDVFNREIENDTEEHVIMDRLKWFVGINGLATSRFFELLKRKHKDKWHLAVKKLMKNIK